MNKSFPTNSPAHLPIARYSAALSAMIANAASVTGIPMRSE
jgi:hypothetical protein